jgi:hypothetical protein
MNPLTRRRILLAFAATALFAAAARAEAIFPVNESGAGSWVFDQPSVVASGSVLHVAFVGDDASGSLQGPSTKVYHAAINGAADFASKATTRSQVLLAPAVAIDNGSPYVNARHPQIALRSASRLVILFQAVPAGGVEPKLFRALLELDNNAVRAQQVAELSDINAGSIAGALVDPSFGLVASDNTLRVAYADNTTGDVYYARAWVDNASLAGSPRLLTTQPGTRGTAPLPRLRLDTQNRSHIAWAANNATATPSAIYYAMVKETSPGADAIGIGATQVLSGGYRWGFPNVLHPAAGRVLVLAADEPFGAAGIAGSLGLCLLNPDGVTHDGNPVNINNAASNAAFFLTPPGEIVLSSNFDAYRPEASLDGSNFVHVAGYGFLGGPPLFQGTPGKYYAMSLSNLTADAGEIAGYARLASYPVPVGGGDVSFASTIGDDYTRPAFIHFSGKTIQFFSGPADPGNVAGGARNLYVTATASTTDPANLAPTKQSGCAMVDEPRGGEAGRVPGAMALFLPAALIGLRKLARKAVAR